MEYSVTSRLPVVMIDRPSPFDTPGDLAIVSGRIGSDGRFPEQGHRNPDRQKVDRPPEEVLDAGVGGNQPRLRNKTCATLHTAAHSPFVNLNRGCWLEPRVTERLNNSETIRHLEGGPANELENRHPPQSAPGPDWENDHERQSGA